MLLTDEEITAIVRECARGSAINRDGSTSHRIARAVIAAYEEKLREQDPVARVSTSGGLVWTHYGFNNVIPTGTLLYARFAPIPEGWQLVPVEPTEKMIKSGRRLGDVSYGDIYKAMLEASSEK